MTLHLKPTDENHVATKFVLIPYLETVEKDVI